MYQAFAFVHLLVIDGISCSIPKKYISFCKLLVVFVVALINIITK